MNWFKRKKKVNDLSEIGDTFAFLQDESTDIYSSFALNRSKLIALNKDLGRIKVDLDSAIDGDLEEGEFRNQKGALLNSINLEVENNKLMIVKIDAFLK